MILKGTAMLTQVALIKNRYAHWVLIKSRYAHWDPAKGHTEIQYDSLMNSLNRSSIWERRERERGERERERERTKEFPSYVLYLYARKESAKPLRSCGHGAFALCSVVALAREKVLRGLPRGVFKSEVSKSVRGSKGLDWRETLFRTSCWKAGGDNSCSARMMWFASRRF